jgi:hypothetical protein
VIVSDPGAVKTRGQRAFFLIVRALAFARPVTMIIPYPTGRFPFRDIPGNELPGYDRIVPTGLAHSKPLTANANAPSLFPAVPCVPGVPGVSLHQHDNRPRPNRIMDAEHLLFLTGLTDVVRRVLSGVDDAVPRLV